MNYYMQININYYMQTQSNQKLSSFFSLYTKKCIKFLLNVTLINKRKKLACHIVDLIIIL